MDFLIIGQGIAGTTLAWQLRLRRLRVLVVDREAGSSASRIAAGLITPVTGKRLAKSWRWAELFPVATAFYRSIEAETGATFFHQRPSVRLFADEAESDEFHRRAASMLAGLVSETEINREWFVAPHSGFEMPHAARLDVPHYLDVSREVFIKNDAFAAADIEPNRDLEVLKNAVQIPRLNVEAAAVVFCRGFDCVSDPWFGGIRFNAAKGEILTLHIPGLAEDRVVHRGLWLAPVGGETFRAGSTYEWDDLTCEPTAAGRADIESRLRTFLRLPFEVIDHRAAVRPVIDAGLPVLGRHPMFPQLAYFNGLGSKGSLLAPFFAEQLAACLTDEREVDSEVDASKLIRA